MTRLTPLNGVGLFTWVTDTRRTRFAKKYNEHVFLCLAELGPKANPSSLGHAFEDETGTAE